MSRYAPLRCLCFCMDRHHLSKFFMNHQQSRAGELGGSQWSVCPESCNTLGFPIYGLYMFNSNPSSILFTNVSILHVLHQRSSYDVCLHDFSLGHSYKILLQLLEENIVTFVKDELKKIQSALSLDYPECLESPSGDEEQRSSRDAFMKITVDFLRRMKEDVLADRLQRGGRILPRILENRWEILRK